MATLEGARMPNLRDKHLAEEAEEVKRLADEAELKAAELEKVEEEVKAKKLKVKK